MRRWCVIVGGVLACALLGCEEGPEEAPTPVVRGLSEAQVLDTLAFCEGVKHCTEAHCDRTAEVSTYRGIRTKTIWGGELKREFASKGTAVMAPHLASSLRQFQMERTSSACQFVAGRYR